jgi:hypothetical protein
MLLTSLIRKWNVSMPLRPNSLIRKATEQETYISSPSFLKVVEARSREFGKSIHAIHAEGFTSKKLLGVDSLGDLR